MSRAFIKETDNPVGDLPERPVSPHRNLVTDEGLAAIDAELGRLEAERAGIPGDDRGAFARIDRDLRYWRARRATAEVAPAPKNTGKVQFGSTVTIRRDDQREQSLMIVGEDEGDPPSGKISYVSPLARAVMGKKAGDVVEVGPVVVEVLAVH